MIFLQSIFGKADSLDEKIRFHFLPKEKMKKNIVDINL